MEKLGISKGVLVYYVISLFLTYLVVLRVDSLDTNIIDQNESVVYLENK